MKKYPKRPDWNINKPLRRYIPASEKYPKQLQKLREEKKVRRQMELLHLVERNNPGHISPNRGTSPEVLHSAHQETEPRFKWQLLKKVKDLLKISVLEFHCGAAEMNPTSIHEDVVSVPGTAVSCGMGSRSCASTCSSDLIPSLRTSICCKRSSKKQKCF